MDKARTAVTAASRMRLQELEAFIFFSYKFISACTPGHLRLKVPPVRKRDDESSQKVIFQSIRFQQQKRFEVQQAHPYYFIKKSRPNVYGAKINPLCSGNGCDLHFRLFDR
jgi:hypothetical protein